MLKINVNKNIDLLHKQLIGDLIDDLFSNHFVCKSDQIVSLLILDREEVSILKKYEVLSNHKIFIKPLELKDFDVIDTKKIRKFNEKKLKNFLKKSFYVLTFFENENTMDKIKKDERDTKILNESFKSLLQNFIKTYKEEIFISNYRSEKIFKKRKKDIEYEINSEENETEDIEIGYSDSDTN